MQSSRWISVRDEINTLAGQLKKYAKYLKSQKENTRCSMSKLSFVQTEREVWNTYPGKELDSSEKVRYGHLNNALLAAQFFELICLNEFTPDTKQRKYDYLNGLSVQCRTVRYTYTGGCKPALGTRTLGVVSQH